MTLVQLRQFAALARAGSFVKASAALHMTQPALSRSIKALEDDLGQLLFDRVGRRIALTPFGRETLQRSLALLEDAQSLRSAGHALTAAHTGRLRLGLGSGPGQLLPVPLIAHFARHFPRIHVDIQRASTDTLVQRLREREADALVLDIRSLRPAPDLKVEQVSEIPGAFLCRPGHPLAGEARVALERILQFPVASTPLSDEVARLLTEQYGERAHPQTLVRYASEEISHLVEVARHTDTVLLAIRPAAPDLVEIRMHPAMKANARFGLVTLAGRAEALVLPEVRKVMAQAMR